ncbi:MAG: M48 family metallopeptidase [Candidatus Blackburnbacteria bacterium]|nr:M48 family metallopeptidase [Candidatus Blackburnbacteria bacterium]
MNLETACIQLADEVHRSVFPGVRGKVKYHFVHDRKLPAALAQPSPPTILFNTAKSELRTELLDVVVHEFTHIGLGIGHNQRFWKEYRKRLLQARLIINKKYL